MRRRHARLHHRHSTIELQPWHTRDSRVAVTHTSQRRGCICRQAGAALLQQCRQSGHCVLSHHHCTHRVGDTVQQVGDDSTSIIHGWMHPIHLGNLQWRERHNSSRTCSMQHHWVSGKQQKQQTWRV